MILATAIAFFSCNDTPSTTTTATGPSKDSLIKRGAYLVLTMGCNDCHSTKRMGAHGPELVPELMLGGHPANMPPNAKLDTSLTNNWVISAMDFTSFIGPWGTSFAANISSDQTGIGGWTLDRFSKALREGKYNGLEGTRTLLPPMPWPNYIKMNDADLEAIFTYLQSIPPVKNLVPQPIPPGGLVKK